MSRPLLATAWMTALCPTLCLAEPLEKPVNGPMLICFKYSVFTLLANERVTDFSGGAEGMRIQVVGRNGKYDIGESEIFATPRDERSLVYASGMTKVYLFDREQDFYGVFGPTSFSEGKDRLVIRLSGQALDGRPTDANVYKRFEVRDPATAHCGFTFTYSWEAVLGLPSSGR